MLTGAGESTPRTHALVIKIAATVDYLVITARCWMLASLFRQCAFLALQCSLHISSVTIAAIIGYGLLTACWLNAGWCI